MEALHDSALLQRAQPIRLLGLDIDGTLTDGRLFIGAAGEQFKAFHVHDGLGLKLLGEHAIEVAWITARHSAIAGARAAELGITTLLQSCRDKRAALEALAAERGLQPAQVAFMGDDLPDLPALRWAGLAVGPANAHPWLWPDLHWRTTLAGGHGAARQLCDLLLLAQGRQVAVLGRYRR